jgi:hypothetical protein
MLKKVVIRVSKRDLDKGVGGDSLNCALALALRTKTKTIWSVGRFRAIEVANRSNWRYIHFSEPITRFISRFDAASKLGRKKLKPFQFTAEIHERKST